MTIGEIDRFVRAVAADVFGQLVGPASEEYSTTENFTSNFDSHFAMYGKDAALSQASEKLYRYKHKGNPRDLIKAIGWIVLLLTKDEKYKSESLQCPNRTYEGQEWFEREFPSANKSTGPD